MANSFYESFNGGTGALGHVWGGGADTSVGGQITLRGHSGAMEHPSGSASGHGYGQYTVTAKVEGNQVGPAALLWPADDRWPGNEMDFVEVLPDGTSYGTAHHGNFGHDWYDAKMYGGNDESGVHTYGIDWQADHVSFSVDGRDAGTVWMNTKDAAHGGTNVVFGAMNKNDATSITVYDMSYTPSGGGSFVQAPAQAAVYEQPAVPAQAAPQEQQASVPAPATLSGPTDWNALAAQVLANYEATGSWFI